MSLNKRTEQGDNKIFNLWHYMAYHVFEILIHGLICSSNKVQSAFVLTAEIKFIIYNLQSICSDITSVGTHSSYMSDYGYKQGNWGQGPLLVLDPGEGSRNTERAFAELDGAHHFSPLSKYSVKGSSHWKTFAFFSWALWWQLQWNTHLLMWGS